MSPIACVLEIWTGLEGRCERLEWDSRRMGMGGSVRVFMYGGLAFLSAVVRIKGG